MIIKNIVLPKNKLKYFHLALDNIKTKLGNIAKISKLKGLSNYNFLIKLDHLKNGKNKTNKFIVLKLLNLNPLTKSNNENIINKYYSDLNICPKILLNEFPNYYIIEYVKSKCLTKSFFDSTNNFNKLINLLFKLHLKENNFFCNTLDFFETNTILLNQIKSDNLVNNLTMKLHILKNALKEYPNTLTFCHNDINKHNFILDKYEKLWCIDFEYSGISDVFFDLVSLRYILNNKSYKNLLTIYHNILSPKMTPKTFNNKLKLFNLLLLTTSSIWYLYMSKCNRYSKYKTVFNKLFASLNCEFNKPIIMHSKKLY